MNKYILFLSVLILLYACNVSKNSSNQAIIENKVGHIGLCSGPDFFSNKKYFGEFACLNFPEENN